MTSTESKMPSSDSSTDLIRCRCDHYHIGHRPYAEGGCRYCACETFQLPEEPPLTPEEEGEAGDCTCSSRTADGRGEVVHADDCPSAPEPGPWPCSDCGTINPPEAEFCSEEGDPCMAYPRADNIAAPCLCDEETPAPPQPLRRPPYAVAYSVGGHLYEIALPGDATIQAVDGGLIITHSLAPVAGVVQVQPVINEENPKHER